jgi:hypothetical protein
MNEVYYLPSLNYLDPGTGSFLAQALIAAGITVGIYFRNLKQMILNFIYKFKKNN